MSTPAAFDGVAALMLVTARAGVQVAAVGALLALDARRISRDASA